MMLFYRMFSHDMPRPRLPEQAVVQNKAKQNEADWQIKAEQNEPDLAGRGEC
jgi:hypothetical protein